MGNEFKPPQFGVPALASRPSCGTEDRLKPGLRTCGTVILCCILVVSLIGCGKQTSGEAPQPSTSAQPASSTNGVSATNAATSTSAPKPQFAKLLGNWLRPDGGYVLEIKSVDAAGKMEAAYFNPNPINVSKALALQDGQTTKVFVELRDVNYPGCTYSLSFDPDADQLFGDYFQAAVQQTYQVAFTRVK